MAALVWMLSGSVAPGESLPWGSLIVRPRAEIMPSVTLLASPSRLPMANTMLQRSLRDSASTEQAQSSNPPWRRNLEIAPQGGDRYAATIASRPIYYGTAHIDRRARIRLVTHDAMSPNQRLTRKFCEVFDRAPQHRHIVNSAEFWQRFGPEKPGLCVYLSKRTTCRRGLRVW